MKSEFSIKPISGLKVNIPKNGIYLVWIPNYIGLIPPKLQYEENSKGELNLTKVKGQIKAISINSAFACGLVIIANLINSEGNLYIEELLPFLIGIIGFMILLNYIVYLSTKWKVEKQIKTRLNRGH